MNDEVAHKANSMMKIVEVDGAPVLALFAKRLILAGEEVRYDYGVKNLPWRKCARLGKILLILFALFGFSQFCTLVYRHPVQFYVPEVSLRHFLSCNLND